MLYMPGTCNGRVSRCCHIESSFTGPPEIWIFCIFLKLSFKKHISPKELGWNYFSITKSLVDQT